MLSLTTFGSWGVSFLEPENLARPRADGGPTKSLALVVYLACSPGQTARRETLIDLLWSDKDPHNADHALRQTVLHLRSRFGDNAITTPTGRVTLSHPFTCDRALFLAAIDAQDYERAASLYAGEFLPGFAAPGGSDFEKWADLERRRLRNLFLLACDNVGRDLLARGRFRDGVTIARRSRDEDPASEAGWRLLLECLLAAGDAVSARVEAGELERLLASDGRTAERATAALIRRALAVDVVTERDKTAFTTEFVGRERQFVVAWEAWKATARSRGHHVHVVGPPGFGKSRLLQELAMRISASGAKVASVRANPGERLVRLALAAELADALAGLRGASGVSPATAGTLIALNPRLSSRFPGATPMPAADRDSDRMLALALNELLECVTDDAPIALVVDDVHWADDASQTLIQSIVDRSTTIGVCVFTSARGGQLQRAGSARVELEPFDLEAMALLITGIATLPGDGWAADLPAAIQRYSQGSPLLAIDVLRLAIARDLLATSAGTWESRDPVQLFAVLAAGGALRQRIADLDAERRRLLELLSAAGVPLALETLASAAGRPPGKVGIDLMALERLGITMQQHDQWTPAHDAIAERALADATDAARREVHGALANALAAASAPHQALMRAAWHYDAAGNETGRSRTLSRLVTESRANGDRRPTRAIVAESLGLGARDIDGATKALPLAVRYSPHWRRAMLMATSTFLTIAAIAAWTAVRPSGPGLDVGVWVDDALMGSRLHAKRITARDLADGLDLKSFQQSSIRSMWQDAAMRPQHPSQWSATRGFSDSGGLDVVLVDAPNAAEQRLTHRPGDDYFGSWSPDGRLMAIATDRWSNESHSAIAIIDPERPERVVRLTGRTGVRDVTPLWSPDGSRVAFVRQDMVGRVRANRVCWVTADGRDSACPGRLTNSAPFGWSNPREIVVATLDSANVQRIVAIEIESGEVRSLVEGRPLGQSRAAGWIACVCRRHRGEPYRTAVMSTEDTSVFMPVRDAEPPPQFTLTSVAPHAGALAHLNIRVVGRVTAGQAHRLRADATDGLGRPMEPVSLQWDSPDSLTATVTPDGLLQPLRPGRVLVRVTSGGWRSDSAVIEINSPLADRDTVEDWRSLSPKWLAFGTPRPYVTTVGGRRALAPNGDSTHSSGVMSNWRLPTRRGVGAEFELSVPVTADQWQHISVGLAKSDATERSGWDTIIGDLPTLRYVWTQCGVYFPTSVAGQFAAHLVLSGGIENAVPVAPGVARGDWVRIRLQYFPDGRCAMAINGRAVAIIDRPLLLGDSVALHVRSYSHRTRVLVGPIRAWTGVRSGVDWSILDPSR